MKSHARNKKWAAAAVVAVPLTLGLLVVPTGTAATGGADIPRGCRFDPRYLPLTPDAVEGWYRSCRERRDQPLSRSATRVPSANGEGPLASAIAVDWQQSAIRTIFAETLPTPAPPVGAMHPSFMSLAVHDAAREAQRSGTRAAAAAVATAAHDVLSEYFPASRARLDADLAASLARVPDGRKEAEGVRVGEAAAGRMIASRVGDGRGDPTVVYDKDPGLGVWQPATGGVMAIAWLAFLDPVVDVPPVVLDGPDPLGSTAYAEDYEEVRMIGSDDSATRTPEQTAIARFFSRNPVLDICDALCRYLESEPLGLLPTTRLFARIDAAEVTSFIQTWRLKYGVGFWRPFQAIAAAEDDGNPVSSGPGRPGSAGHQPVVLRLHQRTRCGDGAVRRDPPQDAGRRRAVAAEVWWVRAPVRDADRSRARRAARADLGWTSRTSGTPWTTATSWATPSRANAIDDPPSHGFRRPGQVVPQRSHVTELGDLGDRGRPTYVVLRGARGGDAVAAAVGGVQLPAAQGSHTLAGRQPGGERHHAAHARIVGDVDRGAATHRVAEEADRHLAQRLLADGVESAACVGDPCGTAVPPAVGEAEQPGADVRLLGAAGDVALHHGRTAPREAATVHALARGPSRRAASGSRLAAAPLRRTGSGGARHGSRSRTVFGAFGLADRVPHCVPDCVPACGQDVPMDDGVTQEVADSSSSQIRAPGAGRADRGGPLALLRAGRPDAVRRRLRQAHAPAPGLEEQWPELRTPTRRPRRSVVRSRPSSPRSTTSSA